MNERFSLPHLMDTITSIPKRFAATVASALCVLMLAVPTWGQVVTISPETTTVQEEDEDEIIFTVMADSDPSSRLTVTYTVTGTATSGADYTAFPTAFGTTEVIFTGTDTAVEVTITIIDDSADEGDTDETIIVTLGAVAGGDTPSLGTAKVATVNIDDDDAATDTANIVITDAAEKRLAKVVVNEGGDATYRVALSKKPTKDVALEIKEYKSEADKDKKDRLTISPSTITFTDENWDKPQAVAVSAGLDENDTDEMVMISHKPTGEDFEDDVEASLFPVDVVDQGNPRVVAVRLSEESASTSPQEDTYGVGEKILLEVEFTKPVVVTGAPQLKVLVDEKEAEGDAAEGEEAEEEEDKLAQYVPPEDDEDAEEGSTTITFAYTVQANDQDADGIGVVDTNPLVLAAGDAIHAAKEDDDDDDVAALTKAAKGTFTVTIPAAATKVDGEKDFLLRAHAGEDVKVKEDKAITLDGSGTTTGEADDNLKYVWKFMGDKDDAPEWLKVSDDVTLEGEGDEEDTISPAGDVATFGTTKVTLEGETVSFNTAKSLAENVTLTFELIVTNTRTKETSKDEVVVTITAEDDEPTADAGSNIDAEEGTVVVLDGSDSSDPEGGDLTYSWKLKDGNASYIHFMDGFDSEIAVIQLRTNIPDRTKLTFELTVTDEAGKAAEEPAEMVVTVVSSRLGAVLEHSLARFSRTLGASAVDTLTERFGPRIGHSPSGLAMNLGDTRMGFGGAAPNAANGLNITNALGVLQDMTFARGGMAGLAMNNASGSGFPEPFATGHFDERLRMRTNNFDDLLDLNRQAIMRSGFEFTMGGADALGASSGGGSGMNFAIWGRFDSRDFEAEPTDTITLDASTTIGYVGGDLRFGADQNIVVGLAVSTAESDVEYTQSDIEGLSPNFLQAVAQAIEQGTLDDLKVTNSLEGEITFNMTTFYPYASMELSDGVSVWGMIGVGSGDAEVTSTIGHLIETDITMNMVALGARNDLQWGSGADFALKGDVLVVNSSADDVLSRKIEDIDTYVQRVRAGMEASRLTPMAGDSFLRGSVEFALRMDAGDVENGLGLEVSAGLAFENDMGLALEGRVRHLAVHTDEDIAETGFSVIGRFDPSGVGGPSLSFAPTWGDMASSADAMWQSDQPMFYDGLLRQGSDANPFHMNTQVQYAFLTRKWSIAPYGLLTVGDATKRERLGLRILPLEITNGNNISLDFFGEQVDGRDGGAMQPGVQATMRLMLR